MSQIALGQLLEQQLHRPAIGDNMMHGQQQNPVVHIEAEQTSAPEGSLSQVEGTVRLLAGQPTQFGLTVVGRQPAQIQMQQGRAADRQEPLDSLTVVVFNPQAQHLVPGFQQAQAG